MRALTACLGVAGCVILAGCSSGPAAPRDAQVLGTVHDSRGRWNPFLADNDMSLDPANGDFVRDFALSATGGRNGDGIYALRFSTGHSLDGLCRADPVAPAGPLLCGAAGRLRGGNLIFRVPRDGTYRVRFDPATGRYGITPPVAVLDRIESMQINGFVHDDESGLETLRDGRVRPAAKWDETLASHQMHRDADGTWVKTLHLSARGGHEHNGVYQFLFSANGNDDWGFCAANDAPGHLRGGCGYASRPGRVDESAVVIRVVRDGDYTIRVRPADLRYRIDPPVESLNRLESFQVNGSVVPRPWVLSDPAHRMTRRADGTWARTLHLVPDGGEAGNGIYVMNFSIGADWALDGIAWGGRWGYVWHALPQESNILFRVTRAGDYTVVLDPAAGRFSVEPPVVPLPRIATLKILGGFAVFADDGGKGWNLDDPRHAMTTRDGRRFVCDIPMRQGEAVLYKYAANDAGWSWGLTDYPYDGEARLSFHGNPPPLEFVAAEAGLYRFHADVVSGRYGVVRIDGTSGETGK